MSTNIYHRLDRIDCKIHEEPNTGCWLWGGAQSAKGYGRVSINNKNKYTHRVMFEEHVGKIGAGMHIDHKCENKSCCNPLHLEQVTPVENMYRAAVANGGGR